MEDAGALPIEMDVAKMEMGDVIDVYPYQGVAKRHGTDEVLAEFALKTPVLLDETRAGGRINLIIGRLTQQGAGSAGAGCVRFVPHPGTARRPRQGLHAGTENGGQGVWPAGRAPWHVLRAENDHGGFAGHHRPHDP